MPAINEKNLYRIFGRVEGYSVISSTERSFYKRLQLIAQPVKNFLYNRNKKLPLFFSDSFLVYCAIPKTTLVTKPNRSIHFSNDNHKIIKNDTRSRATASAHFP